MSELLWLNWSKSADGHQIDEFDPREIDWSFGFGTVDDLALREWRVPAPENASASTIRLLEKWGTRLEPQWEDEDGAALEPLPYLVVNPTGNRNVQYFPLQMGCSLFQEFAETRKTPEDVKRFADKYGLLRNDGLGPETVEFWYRQIDRMRKAVKVWQKDRDKDLSRFVTRFSFHLTHGGHRFFFDEQDELIPASIFLGKTEDPTRPRLRIEPKDLLAAMWLELALAVEGNSNYRPCDVCPTWFEVAPGSGREDKTYCSDACRMRAYRKRKAASRSK